MQKSKTVQPVLKWVGGKRQLLNEIKKYLPKNPTAYYEPFMGGGAVLFALQPQKAIVNDINPELINVYEVIQQDVEGLIAELSQQEKYQNTAEAFYKIREMDRNPDQYQKLSPVQKAARILYLNKTCYNGLYRVNSSGEFNSPFGNYKNPNMINAKTLKAVNKYFNKADIRFLNEDFTQTVKRIKLGSFVYFDPPYVPLSKTSNFTGYNENGFGEKEQKKLKRLCDRLTKKGIEVLVSNSDCPFIRELYKDYEIIQIKAKRAINSKANGRGEINEVLIRNHDLL